MFNPNSFTVTPEVHRAIRLIARGNDEQPPDLLADKILLAWIKKNQPDVLNFMAQREIETEAYVKTLKKDYGL